MIKWLKSCQPKAERGSGGGGASLGGPLSLTAETQLCDGVGGVGDRFYSSGDSGRWFLDTVCVFVEMDEANHIQKLSLHLLRQFFLYEVYSKELC